MTDISAVYIWGISTHTLTWSVTKVDENGNVVANISTHTLTWSVTEIVTTTDQGIVNFNSHAHVERDQAERHCRQEIHHFNSHAHVERDQNGYDLPENISDFNSHAHVERDYSGVRLEV